MYPYLLLRLLADSDSFDFSLLEGELLLLLLLLLLLTEEPELFDDDLDGAVLTCRWLC